MLLKEHFFGVDQIVTQYTIAKKKSKKGPKEEYKEPTTINTVMANEGSGDESESNSSFDSSTEDYSVGKIKVDQLDQINGKQLEGVAQDFSYNYKQKAE